MSERAPAYDLRPCTMATVADLCAKHHGYKSAGKFAAYAFAVYEDGRPVAAFAWQPPPPGAARAACPEAPQGVLSLSRMVAVPKDERRLKHISKPLRRQMRQLIDRGRWPVLVTFHDEGEGHNGFVYECSGWTKRGKPEERPFYVDEAGARLSSYSNGAHGARELVRGGTTLIQAWENMACPRGQAAEWMRAHGWARVAIVGKVWRSGNQAFAWVQGAL